MDLLLDAFLGLVWTVLLVTFLATSIGSIPAAGVGVLLLVATTLTARWAAELERRRAAALRDVEIPRPIRRTTRTTGLWRPVVQAFVDLADPVTWRALAHHLVSTVLGWGFLSLVTLAPFIVTTARSGPLPGLLPGGTAGGVTASVVLLVVTVLYVWGAGSLDRALAPLLLGSSRTAALQDRIHALADARQGAVDAATTERLRIERDLHDGVQPRLVSVGMTLGLAQQKIDDDPGAAKELIAEAHTSTKAAITELRQLARGIHASVLDDRGLDAALSALAGRSHIPVHLDVRMDGRCSREAEAAVYFSIAESLTNAAKHSRASETRVTVRLREGGVLWARVEDNGMGGAQVQPGGGLDGIANRILAAGGTFRLDSPQGGPTSLEVNVPCAS